MFEEVYSSIRSGTYMNRRKEFVIKDPNAYQSGKNYPREARRNRIWVDMKKEAILLPISDYLVPYHISLIRRVVPKENELRIVFKHPGSKATQNETNHHFTHPDHLFVSEFTFRFDHLEYMKSIVSRINEVRKNVIARQKRILQRASLQEQPALQTFPRNSNQIFRLDGISMRPPLPKTKKAFGRLTTHQNGLRYTLGNRNVDIIFSNVKNFILQKARNSLIVVIHFDLIHAISYGGKKPTKHIQFFSEVGTSSMNLNGMRSSGNDLMAEKREREMKKRTNRKFALYAKKIEKVSGIKFESPIPQFSFIGAIEKKNSVTLYPTTNCLVNVENTPFLVITLDEVQIVYFERASLQLKSFDMVFVYKDPNQEPTHIASIEMGKIEHLKDWVNSVGIKFYASPKSLNWKGIMEAITSNPEDFWFRRKGWKYFDQIRKNEEREESSDEYNPSGEEDDFDIEESSSEEVDLMDEESDVEISDISDISSEEEPVRRKRKSQPSNSERNRKRRRRS
eukprot:TRINITY_DN8531_c0_g1_i2.p1 TRINITY_DN8531_c0_g1~~TRINITY_DN8531_c0_g1_i2.p1  ORF type:complete len:509 (-),score=136.59 TRINITY_DN8531_c0_g1_i2:130-1656(-)